MRRLICHGCSANPIDVRWDLGTLCAVEDLGLGGWAELFFSVGIIEIGLGVFGIYATYFHIWLLFYLFAMVLLWLAAIWLALFLPGYYAVMNRSFYELALSGGLQQRFIATADPDSPEMKTLASSQRTFLSNAIMSFGQKEPPQPTPSFCSSIGVI